MVESGRRDDGTVSKMVAKKETRAGIFQPALRVRVGCGWEFQTRTRPASNPRAKTRGYAQPVIYPTYLHYRLELQPWIVALFSSHGLQSIL